MPPPSTPPEIIRGAAQIYTTAADIASSDTAKGQALYMAAESSYRAGLYTQAIADYQTYMKKYPGGSHTETALLGVGYSQYFSNDFLKSAQTFQNFIDRYPSSKLLPDAYMRMGIVSSIIKTIRRRWAYTRPRHQSSPVILHRPTRGIKWGSRTSVSGSSHRL